MVMLDIKKFHKPNVYIRIRSVKELKELVEFCEEHKLHKDFESSEDELRHWVFYLRNFDNDICINTVGFVKTPSKHVFNNPNYVMLNFDNIRIS